MVVYTLLVASNFFELLIGFFGSLKRFQYWIDQEDIRMGLWVAGGYGAPQGHSDERNNTWQVADHYSARSNQTLEERENSPIIHLKKLNNWVGLRFAALYGRPWHDYASVSLAQLARAPCLPFNLSVCWQIKSVLIQLYARPGDCVLDLACGKVRGHVASGIVRKQQWLLHLKIVLLGDLIKWDKAKVGYHVGVDIAKGSVSFVPHQAFMLYVFK